MEDFMVNEAVFEHIKVRYLFLWLILFFILAVFLYAGTTNLVTEAEVNVVVSFLFYGIISLWIIRNFHRVKVNSERFFGHLPHNYNWFYLFIIIFGVIILSLGLGELSRYILSIIDPNILNELPSTSLFYNQSETPLAPILNYIEFIVAVIISPSLKKSY